MNLKKNLILTLLLLIQPLSVHLFLSGKIFEITAIAQAKETYICPMHPNIRQHEPGKCPVCGMDLVLTEEGSSGEPAMSEQHQHSDDPVTMYTCPMHPNIKQDSEGKCPICGMDLVPIQRESGTVKKDDESIRISTASRRLARIETETVQKSITHKKIEAVGSVDFDEGRISTIAAYVDARIEKLYANYTGVRVKKGEHLAQLYSPELYSAQVEFLQISRTLGSMSGSGLSSTRSSQSALLINAERKLKELGMSDAQIKILKKTKKAKSRLTMDSMVSGTVIEKNASEGRYVKAGQVIYKVADLSTVWLLLDMFPEESALLKFGLKVDAKVRSATDKLFTGRISFISPVIDKKTRTVRVRVEIPNTEGILRPGDYASASVEVPVTTSGPGGKTYDPELAGKYISPMHPQEISDKPGKCPICGMPLIPAEEFGFTDIKSELEPVIHIPRNAILSVGASHAVFVETEKNRFSLRSVTMGPVTEGNRVVILGGLKEGETVASNGVFLIDSQMQLSGKTSLMQLSTKKAEAEKNGTKNTTDKH